MNKSGLGLKTHTSELLPVKGELKCPKPQGHKDSPDISKEWQMVIMLHWGCSITLKVSQSSVHGDMCYSHRLTGNEDSGVKELLVIHNTCSE